jgi:hypothetical protein
MICTIFVAGYVGPRATVYTINNYVVVRYHISQSAIFWLHLFMKNLHSEGNQPYLQIWSLVPKYDQYRLATADNFPAIKRSGRSHPCNIEVRNATSNFTSHIKPLWLGKKSVESPCTTTSVAFPFGHKFIPIIMSWINYKVNRSVISYTFLISDFCYVVIFILALSF